MQIVRLSIYAAITMLLIVSFNQWGNASYFILMGVVCLLVPILFLTYDEDLSLDEKGRGVNVNYG